jgi:DNA-binding winged helix-turn-helix (wHTH) protein/Tfp pilus assembly protein PilF
MDTPADIHFDGWTLRRQLRELLRDGVRVPLQDKPLHVLEVLLSAPGELVTREHLIAQLWPKRIVEFDAALNAAVRRLRAALDDEAETPRYIETVPRQGYRFVGKIRDWCEPAAEAVPPEATLASVSPPLPDVLPSSQRAGRGVTRAGVLTAAAAVIASVGVVAAWVGHNSAEQAARDESALVSEAMERARFFSQRRQAGDLERARSEFGRALSLAPNQAKAWAGLASVYWLETASGVRTRESGLPKVRDAAQRALELDSTLAEAHIRLASYLFSTGRRKAALEHRDLAAAIDPNDPLVLNILASVAADEGRWDEAIAYQQRAVIAEPLSVAAAQNLACYLFFDGRIEEAKKQSARAFELDPAQPDEIGVLAEILEGRFVQSLHMVEGWPDGNVRNYVLALIYHGLGRDAEASQRLENLKTSKTWDNNVLVAEVYSFWGDIDEAFRWLENPGSDGAKAPQPLQFASPLLKPLHGDARWARLVQAQPRT